MFKPDLTQFKNETKEPIIDQSLCAIDDRDIDRRPKGI